MSSKNRSSKNKRLALVLGICGVGIFAILMFSYAIPMVSHAPSVEDASQAESTDSSSEPDSNSATTELKEETTETNE